MKKIKWFILVVVLGCYAFLYIATKPNTCFEDCEKVGELSEALRQNREIYFFGAYRCGYMQTTSDSLCIIVKDTLGIDWNLFADTVCEKATSKGLLHQKVFIFKSGTYPMDTLARKVCP
jgi:hypothetical protein